MHVVTEIDPQTSALFARNAYNTEFEGRVAFAASSELARSHTGNRTEFLGRNGTSRSRPRSGVRGFREKPVPASIPARPCRCRWNWSRARNGKSPSFSARDKTVEHARDLARRFQNLEACRNELQKVWEFWGHTLSAVRVETPEPALDLLANGWLLYQTISCRLWARTGFYQSGGAFGFRDQLQDAMALVHARPELLREQLLRAAAHQFREGDVQHWWHPPLGRGVRTHFSDDYLWLRLRHLPLR